MIDFVFPLWKVSLKRPVINSICINETQSSVTIFASTTNRCLQLFGWGILSYLHYLCLLAYIGIQHILYCVFVLNSFVLSNLCWQCLDFPLVIVPSSFSNVYFHLLSLNKKMLTYSDVYLGLEQLQTCEVINRYKCIIVVVYHNRCNAICFHLKR